jgi:RHS repeat-associated protein
LLSDGTYNYTYDNEGNVLTRTRIADGQQTTYTWDYRNRLTEAVTRTSGGTVVDDEKFTYDVENRLIGRNINGTQTWTAYSGANVYADFDANGSLTYRYLILPGSQAPIARDDSSNAVSWYLTDRLGSVRQLTDTSGTVLDAVNYDSFGKVLSETSPANGDRFKFAQMEYSPGLGEYHAGARWQNPASGRFDSEDPISFAGGSFNIYAYAGNDPINKIDPSGMIWYPGKYLYQYYREWRRGRELDAKLDEVQRRRHDPVAAVMQSRGGTWSVRSGYTMANPAFERNWQQGMRDVATLANVGVQWAAAGGTFVSPQRVVGGVVRSTAAARGGTSCAAAQKVAPTTTTPANSPLLRRYLSESGGRWGGTATRQLNHRLATDLETRGFRVTGGAGRGPEEWIRGPGGGARGGTWVDITATNGTQTIRIQTVTTLADGVTPTATEAAAAARIRAQFPNDTLILVSKQTGLVIP